MGRPFVCGFIQRKRTESAFVFGTSLLKGNTNPVLEAAPVVKVQLKLVCNALSARSLIPVVSVAV